MLKVILILGITIFSIISLLALGEGNFKWVGKYSQQIITIYFIIIFYSIFMLMIGKCIL